MATTSPTRRLLSLLALITAFAMTAAACGGSSSGGDAASSDGTSAGSEDAGSAEASSEDAMSEDAMSEEASSEDAMSEEAMSEPYQIAYLSASSANTWLLASLAEMEKAAGDQAVITEFDAQFDPSLQTTQFQDVIAAGTYDGVVLVSINGVGSVPDIEAALEAGMEVVVLNQVVGEDFTTSDPQVDGVSASVLAAPLLNGKRLGQLAVQACEGIDPCEVVYIYGIKGIPIDDALKAGFDEVLADHPSMTIVAEGEGKYLGPDGGINATQDILQIAPNFNVLVGADQSVQGAEIVLKDEGKLDQVALIGLGGSEPALAGIASGAWFGGVFGAPADEGRLAMEALLGALSGGGDAGGVDALIGMPGDGLITSANVSEFTAQWAG